MNRYIVFLFALSFLAFTSVVMADGKDKPEGESSKKSKTSKPTRYVDKEHRFTFTPPLGWIKVKPKKQVEDLLVVYAAPESSPNLNVQVVKNWVWPSQKGKKKKSKRTLEEFKYLIENFVDQLKKLYKNNLNAKPRVSLTSGEGRYVIQVETRYTRKGKKTPIKQVTLHGIVFYKDLTVIFTFTCSQEKYSQLRPLFLGTLDSVERTKASTPK